jgi:PAS domain S-box-containing protein
VQSMLDHTPFFLAHCSSDLRYVSASRSYAELMGLGVDEIIGKRVVDVVGTKAFETMRPHIEAVLAGERVEYEAEMKFGDLGPRQYHIISVPVRDREHDVVGYVVSVNDITERNRAIAEKIRLERLVAQLSLPLASARVGIWDWDMRAGSVNCTPEFEAIFGVETNSLRSYAELSKLVHPDDMRDSVTRRLGAIKAHKTFQTEYRIIRPDGQMRWVMGVGGAVYDKVTGEPVRVMGSCVDITDMKANEAQLEFQRKELTHVMRVSTLGGLAGGIAHELSQPLASILANAEAAQTMLAARTPDLEQVGAILYDIVQENNRAGQVIRHLRELLQKREHFKASISLNELIGSTLQLLHSELASRKIKVDTELQTDLPSITGDSVELQQVLINLIVNAIDAMTSTPPSECTISIATEETKDGNVVVSIRDRGPGMSPDKLKRSFEPFFTTKTGGLGLGLSICSNIVMLHHGQLTLRNASEGGIVATVSLPKSAQCAIAS